MKNSRHCHFNFDISEYLSYIQYKLSWKLQRIDQVFTLNYQRKLLIWVGWRNQILPFYTVKALIVMAKKIFAVKQKPICPVTTILDFGLENIVILFLFFQSVLNKKIFSQFNLTDILCPLVAIVLHWSKIIKFLQICLFIFVFSSLVNQKLVCIIAAKLDIRSK